MVCPNDGTQMVQYKKLGGGESTDERYVTWEIKICPHCKRLVKEYYSAVVLSEGDIARLVEQIENGG